jgi:hypothetical protein
MDWLQFSDHAFTFLLWLFALAMVSKAIDSWVVVNAMREKISPEEMDALRKTTARKVREQ